MTERVFPRECTDGLAHSIQFAPSTKTGGDDRVLFCSRCGDAVKVSVALARTPTPVTIKGWTYEFNDQSGTWSTGGQS